jgi:DNA-binding CsgD family transcriptional regulator
MSIGKTRATPNSRDKKRAKRRIAPPRRFPNRTPSNSQQGTVEPLMETQEPPCISAAAYFLREDGTQMEVSARKFGDEMVRRFTRPRPPSNFRETEQIWRLLEERRIRRRLAWCFLGHIEKDRPDGRRRALSRFAMLNDSLLNLTPRQQAIASYLLRGLENKEIAGKLQISPETVKKHIDNMMQKANVDNRSKLLRWCLQI